MVQTFGDHYRDAVEGRGESRLRFWLAVLSDTGTSLIIEHAAELRARHRQVPKAARRRRRSGKCADQHQMTGTRKPTVRVARRLRYRRRSDRPVRVLLRARHHRLAYRGRLIPLIASTAVTGVALATGTATGHLRIGALVAGLTVAAWLAHSLRLTRPVPAGPHGDGPAPPGGASVREPRRPLPTSPAGSTARTRPGHDEPGQAIALI
jgi:hypothetical protein